LRGLHIFLIALLAATAASAGPKDDLATFASSAQKGLTAYKAGDFKAAEPAFDTALANAPQRSAVLYYLSAAAARNGERAKALLLLDRYARMGGTKDVAAADFASLATSPGFRTAEARVANNRRALCACSIVFQGTSEPFIAEGLAPDGKRLLLSSVAQRRIVAIADGRETDFVTQLPDAYSPFGMVADAKRNTLWVSAASVPQGGSADTDKSALIAYDLATGSLRKIYPASGKLDFGDIALAPDGAVYVSDSLEGSLFRLLPGAAELERVGPAGMFSSAQGMAVSTDSKQLLVADYEMGLFRVDLQTQQMKAVRIPQTLTTLGIDGLAHFPDGSFVATQNGIAAPRIIRFRLTADWSALRSLTTLATNAPPIADIALIAADGNDVLAVGVSQWSAFESDKQAPAHPVPPWVIVRIGYSSRS
jgi:sugar lactone lactonase YvrE